MEGSLPPAIALAVLSALLAAAAAAAANVAVAGEDAGDAHRIFTTMNPVVKANGEAVVNIMRQRLYELSIPVRLQEEYTRRMKTALPCVRHVVGTLPLNIVRLITSYLQPIYTDCEPLLSSYKETASDEALEMLFKFCIGARGEDDFKQAPIELRYKVRETNRCLLAVLNGD